MKKLIYTILLTGVLRALPAMGQTAPIPDPGFLQCLKDHASSTVDASNQLIISQAATVTTLGCVATYDIANLDGLQYFTGLVTLDLDDNLITNVNHISSLTALQTLRLENNHLTSLPSLSGLTNLKTLVAYDNFLESLPDFSANTQLQSLNVENNSLTELPNLTGLPNLTTLRIRNNYFSYEDLNPYLSFSGTLAINPQKKVPVVNPSISVYAGSSLTLTTGIDASSSNVTYAWYRNGVLISTVAKDTLIINQATAADAGKYSVVLSNPSYAFTILTDTILVNVLPCPDLSSTFKPGRVNCTETGTLEIVPPSATGLTYTYYLSSPITGDTVSSTIGYFDGLNQPEYLLTIKTNSVCQADTVVKLAFEDCKEVFITPDGDGDKDSHFFNASGTATIYDKNGIQVKTLSLPGEWDGSSLSGQLVSPGYYSADINSGEKHVNISVLY